MFEDLLKDTWAYKEIMEEGYTEGYNRGLTTGVEEGKQVGLKEGIKEGIKEGVEQERQQRVEDHRRLIANYVQARFPILASFAQKQVYITNDLDTLEKMANKLFLAQSVEEAQQLLATIHSNGSN